MPQSGSTRHCGGPIASCFLKLVKFEKGGARQEEMTKEYAGAFIRTAPDLGDRGFIPADRARYTVLGVAAQFELGLRQKDIVGEWRPDETWAGYFPWENNPSWRWRMKTSKSKYRTAAEFDDQRYISAFGTTPLKGLGMAKSDSTKDHMRRMGALQGRR